ncbi:unnamed protein product [Rhizopus stolonifer]
METNNETLFNRLSSFSSRASKIPQRIAQSSLFSLRPSISTTITTTHESRSQPTKTETEKTYYSLPKTERKLRTTLDFSRLDQKQQTFHDTLPSYNSSNSSVSSLSNESSTLVYTISEWIERLEEKCLILLIHPDTFLTQEIIKDTKILLNACEIEQTLDSMTSISTTSLVKKVRAICQNCANHSLISYCVESEKFEKETTRILKQEYQQDFELDPRIKEASWFRQHFIGNPYITLIGPLEDSQGIITILQQGNEYRIIIRGKGTRYFLVSEQMAKEVHELKGRRLFFRKEVGFMESALLSICPHLDLRSFKELSAEFTRLAGLERDLLRYDALAVPEHYKFGLLNIKNGQTTEKAWMRNVGLSKNLLDFLNIMGHKISLKGYKGYAGGLDKRVDEAGEYTFVSKWKEHEIAFHVGPMMPLKKNDDQQVQRKRHIGNDIVSIIFIEEDQAFDPRAIISNFVFVFIVIHPELIQGKRQWRVEVIKNKKIDSFDPPLPSPPLFNDQDLKSFLTLKSKKKKKKKKKINLSCSDSC